MLSRAVKYQMRLDPLKRRDFIALLGSAATWPVAARAQHPALPVIGYLSSLTQADSVRFDVALRHGFSDMGYVEGQNISIQYRWITERYDTLPAMAADLVQRQVAVILAIGPPAVLVAKATTQTIPIVFVTGADPLKFGFVASFNKPGANITGIWMVTTVLAQKRLQLLHDLLPNAELIALLVNPTSPVAEPQTRDAQAAARALGLRLPSSSSVLMRCSSAPIRSSPAGVNTLSRSQYDIQSRRFMNFVSLSKPVDS